MSEGTKRDSGGRVLLWVFAEHDGERLARVSTEVLGRARELAVELNGEVWGILLGFGVRGLCDELICHGADAVLLGNDPVFAGHDIGVYCRALTDAVLEHDPAAVLMGATDTGRDLAPRVAARLGTGLTSDCVALGVQHETGMLLQVKRGYSGEMLYTYVCPEHRPQMATVAPGALKAGPRDTLRQGRVVPLPVSKPGEEPMITVLRDEKKEAVELNPEEAGVVVACGRGIGGLDGFRRLEQFAGLLGAAVVGTKEITDCGWLPESRLVGQTGITVKPELYVACGVSGAVQHTCGMWDSGVIVAINKDPKAEIFRIADYGIVADVNQVIPALIAELRKRQGLGGSGAGG